MRSHDKPRNRSPIANPLYVPLVIRSREGETQDDPHFEPRASGPLHGARP